MRAVALNDSLVRRLYSEANAGRWHLPIEEFREALETSVSRAFRDIEQVDPRELERYCGALRLDDLALARACALGIEEAWEYFIGNARPHLNRAADALDPGGGARELAETLFADLYGLRQAGGARQSLFRYFHGRSSLTTWLRAVLSQRYVDRVRAQRAHEPLPEEESPDALRSLAPDPQPERRRYAALMQAGLRDAVGALEDRDRFRLACYYAQEMTLAAIGRLTSEHEATVSRQLARTRARIRQFVERMLTEQGLSAAEIEECFASNISDPGELDLKAMLGQARKAVAPGRSI